MPESTAVVVLGMHRSGTSAITRALAELGVHLGTKIMPGAPSNPKGFWEDMEIWALNERLMEAIGLRWHSVSPIHHSVWQRPETVRFMPEALELVRARGAVSAVWGFKDPRTARLLPFWKAVLQRERVDIRYLIACRSPISVARSLAKRDGFAPEKAYLLWLQHLVPAMAQTAGAPTVVVDYDNLLAWPERELLRISSALRLQPPSPADLETSEYIKGFLDTELRHSAFLPADLALDPGAARLVRETNELVQALARDEKRLSDSAVVDTVERISAALDDLGPFTTYLERRECDLESKEMELATEREAGVRHEARLASEASRVTQLIAAVSERDAKVAALDAEVAARDSNIATVNAALTARDSKIAALDATVVARDSNIAALDAAVTARDSKIATLDAAAAARDSRIAALEATLLERDLRIEAAVFSIEQFHASTSWRITAPLRTLKKFWLSRR